MLRMVAPSGRHDLALFPSPSAMLGFVKGFRSPFGGVEFSVLVNPVYSVEQDCLLLLVLQLLSFPRDAPCSPWLMLFAFDFDLFNFFMSFMVNTFCL